MGEILNTIKTRRSIRKFKPDMIPKESLDKIIEAGTYAATGRGKQSPIILAVTNKEIRDKLSDWNAAIMGTDSDPFYGAPVVLVVLADKTRPTAVYDGTLVMANLMLEAVGFTEPKKSLSQKKEKNCYNPWALREITRESVTVFLDMWTESIRRLRKEKKTGYIM